MWTERFKLYVDDAKVRYGSHHYYSYIVKLHVTKSMKTWQILHNETGSKHECPDKTVILDQQQKKRVKEVTLVRNSHLCTKLIFFYFFLNNDSQFAIVTIIYLYILLYKCAAYYINQCGQ